MLACDYSSALALLLKYPSPEPHSPESFVLDALFLEENLSLDGGSLLISKYSSRSPDFKEYSKQFHRARTTSQKRSSQSRSLSSRTSQRNSPGISPLRINQKRLDSLFHDVSDGIYRRTEAWGVAKAVRGAVNEARRNIQGIQTSPGTPRLSSEDGPTPSVSSTTRIEVAANRELRSKIAALENRNKELADMLGDALEALLDHDATPEKGSTEFFRKSIGTIERVYALLRNSSLPVADSPEEGNTFTDPQPAPVEIKERPLVEKTTTNRPASANIPISTSSTSSTSSEPVKDSRATDLAKPIPVRPVPRASLAESSFSWMLGGDERRSAFAPCASVPPENMRKHEARARPATLFGDDRGDGKHSKRVGEAGNDVLVLDQLQGKPAEE